MWTIYVTNDNCPDYTWGLTEDQTRRAFAEIVRSHLDEMTRTDSQGSAGRSRYNMAVTQEALCFIERYPQRRDELIRRIREGRVFVSPYLCNSLWAFQGVEGALRTFYPARRLEREWGVPMDVAEHIEQPALPWGVASLLAASGVRWLSVPFYNYDSTFGGLTNLPLFVLEGPDGSRVRVVLDPWASGRFSYTQGAQVLSRPRSILTEWLPHYRDLGAAYPLRAILASGTHGDISPISGDNGRGFAETIVRYNFSPGPHPTLVNATLRQFCQAVDEYEAETPFLAALRGCFGHSWDLWPVCLAKYAAGMREGERALLAAEALLAAALTRDPALHETTRPDRERAEWCLAMLADHAWNGTDDRNRRHNAALRRRWSEDLNRLSADLVERAWRGLGLERTERDVTLFNSLSVPRADLVRVEVQPDVRGAAADGQDLPAQVVEEDGRRVLYFVSPEVPGFGLRQVGLSSAVGGQGAESPLRAGPTELDSPHYRLAVEPRTGAVASLVHKATGTELVVPGKGGLCRTVYFAGRPHALTNVTSEVVAEGPVLARLRIHGTCAGIDVTTFVTVYAGLDRVDFDLRIDKPVATVEERLCQVFPLVREGAVLRVETTGAVIRPRPQPAGDLLPGADTRRFAVQGFVDASVPDGIGVTLVPIDAFALRLDLDPITFEALGNDQNYREAVRDQDGVTQFRFRYALRAHGGGYRGEETFALSRAAATPLLAAPGKLPDKAGLQPLVALEPGRAIATCLKPADGDASGGCILRLWEVAGRSGPMSVALEGCTRAVATDLLERDQRPLPVAGGKVAIDLPAHGFRALRLLP